MLPFAYRMRNVLRLLAVVMLAVSPFLVYLAVKITSPEPSPPWPADVAIATSWTGDLADLALLHFGPRPLVLRFPVETVLLVPGAGQLPSSAGFRLGGARRMAAAMEATFSLTVPYEAEGAMPDALSVFEAGSVTTNLKNHRREAALILRDAAKGAVPVLAAPGTWQGGQPRSFVPDRSALRQLLSLPARANSFLFGPPEASPSPQNPATPSPARSASLAGTTVEVLNAGALPGSAGRIAAKLQAKGFRVTRIDNFAGPKADGLIIYYRGDPGLGAGVARTIGAAAEAQPLPSSLKSTADVVVLVGRSG